MPGREIAVARELTKLYEECRTGTAEELIAHYEAHPARGEIVLLVAPPAEQVADAGDADTLLLEALATEKPSQAAARRRPGHGARPQGALRPGARAEGA